MARRFRKLTLLLVMSALLLAACSSGNTSNSSNDKGNTQTPAPSTSGEAATEKEPVREPITLTIYGPPMNGMTPGILDVPYANEIERRFNVKLDLIDTIGWTDPTKMNMMLASGDLPDILYSGDFLQQLIEGQLILPLEDLVNEYAPNIKNEVPELLEYSKQNLSNDTGILYVIPSQDGPATKAYSYNNMGMNIRWDYYKEMGYPKFNNWDEFLEMLKQMQDKYSENEAGQKVYAFSGWNDWGMWFYNTFPQFYLAGVQNMSGNIDMRPDNSIVPGGLIDENNSVWQAARFWYKANQKGILDPDTFTQKYDNFMDKMKTHRVLLNVAGWAGVGTVNNQFVKDGEPLKGFQPLPPFENGYAYLGYSNEFGAKGRNFAISKKTKHPERAMEVIDFIMSYEGGMWIQTGEKGVDWIEENGTVRLTDEAVDRYLNPSNENTRPVWDRNFAGRGGNVIHPTYNKPLNLYNTDQIYQLRAKTNELDIAYSEYYGVSYPGEIVDNMAKEGKVTILDFKSDDLRITSSDDIKRYESDVTDFLLTGVPKLILSKNDAEFEANRKQLLDKLIDAGYNKVYEYYEKQYTDALDPLNQNKQK